MSIPRATRTFSILMTHRFYKFEVSAYSFFALDAFAFDGEGKSRKDTLCVLYNREQLQTRKLLLKQRQRSRTRAGTRNARQSTGAQQKREQC